MLRKPPFRLPRWRWAYAAFRVGEGAVQPLIPLWVVIHYGLPLWAVAATAAVMNLAAVPGAFFWSRAMESGRGRRRLAAAGFLVAGVALAIMVVSPPYPVFLLAAALFAFWGVATVPAAAALVLEDVPRARWAAAQGTLSKLSSWAYLAGAVLVLLAAWFGLMRVPVVFAGVAVLCGLAAWIAWVTVPPFVPRVGDAPPELDEVQAAQRRNERVVFVPPQLRLRGWASSVRTAMRGETGPLMAGVMLLMLGVVAFLSSYPGVLADQLGYSVGLVLFVQVVSLLVIPLAYPLAVHLAERLGEVRGLRVAAGLRTVSVAGFALAVLVLGPTGSSALLPVLLVCQVLLGVGFSFLQVNGPCLMARIHPRGKGAGVGAYQAAMAAGTLIGAGASFLILLAAPLWVTYLVALAASVAGSVLLMPRRRGPLPGSTAPSPHAP